MIRKATGDAIFHNKASRTLLGETITPYIPPYMYQ
jgi:hypothetical protein